MQRVNDPVARMHVAPRLSRIRDRIRLSKPWGIYAGMALLAASFCLSMLIALMETI
ncbi:MAG: hypothetical protein KJ901_03135 [Gammaproteobacteria bacterium]|nr:hypothetical protein [Gammaproteobacteria bacterium]MBU1441162.1 hypothetical protein [Gammaproteobacteria bacterium]